MVMFMSTFNSCRTEVYDPADCLADNKDLDTLSRALRKILGGVHGADGEPVLWDCIERPVPKDSRPSRVSSGVLAVEYAVPWIKEYTESILGERCFFEKYLQRASQGYKSDSKHMPVKPETPLLKQTNIKVKALRIKMAKSLSDLHHNQQAVDSSEDSSNDASESESDVSGGLRYTGENISELLDSEYVYESSSGSETEDDVPRISGF